jgi:hypothetical protein
LWGQRLLDRIQERFELLRSRGAIRGEQVKAWWFNPRNGEATSIGTFANGGDREFTPPDKGETLDWILVLDDTDKNYPPPGARK